MKKLIALLAATAAIGCSSGSSTRLSLSAGARASTAQGLATGTASAALAAGTGIEVTRVRMVVERIKLELAGADGGTDGGADGGTDGGSSGEFALGPYLIDLSGAALQSGVTQVFEVDVPSGDYHQIKFKIHKLDGGDTRFPEMAGLSLRVDGTVDGQPFTFTSSLDEEQEREGTFRMQSGQSNNVTLAVDPSGWFTDPSSGARLDPSLAATDGTVRSRIESNIKASIDVFDDEDGDCRPDDGS